MTNVIRSVQNALYRENGFAILPQVIGKSAIQALNVSTVRVLQKYMPSVPDDLRGAEPWMSPDFHKFLVMLREESPESFGALYDTMQSSLSLFDLLTNENLNREVADLLEDTETGLATSGQMLRMDPPFDKRNVLGWHQESSYYVQNISGNHGAVCWIPMQELTLEHGPIIVCPGSHKVGPIRVATLGKRDYGTSEQFEIPQEQLASFESASILIRAGDAVVFGGGKKQGDSCQ